MSRRATRASQRSSLARGEERTRTRGVPLALTRHEERTRDMNYAIAQHGLDWRWHTTTTASRHSQDFLLVTTQPTQRAERSGEEQLVPLLPTWSTLFRQKTYFLLPFPALMSTNFMFERSESANLLVLALQGVKWGRWNGKCQKEVARFVRSLRQHKRSIEVNSQCFCPSSLLLTWNVLTRVQVRAYTLTKTPPPLITKP